MVIFVKVEKKLPTRVCERIDVALASRWRRDYRPEVARDELMATFASMWDEATAQGLREMC